MRWQKPVVVVVQGAVAGAGLALMLSCDLIVSAPATKFVFAYPGIGFTPDCGLSYPMPRAIGHQRALSFALGGRGIEANQALEWGLVTEIADDPDARAREVATAWAPVLPRPSVRPEDCSAHRGSSTGPARVPRSRARPAGWCRAKRLRR